MSQNIWLCWIHTFSLLIRIVTVTTILMGISYMPGPMPITLHAIMKFNSYKNTVDGTTINISISQLKYRDIPKITWVMKQNKFWQMTSKSAPFGHCKYLFICLNYTISICQLKVHYVWKLHLLNHQFKGCFFSSVISDRWNLSKDKRFWVIWSKFPHFPAFLLSQYCFQSAFQFSFSLPQDFVQ